jgi:hypothetical protein
MSKSFISVLVLLLILLALEGCASRKKSYNEKKGLMLLETTQLGRNKVYYSKHKAKKIDHNYKKIVKKRKYTQLEQPVRADN